MGDLSQCGGKTIMIMIIIIIIIIIMMMIADWREEPGGEG